MIKKQKQLESKSVFGNQGVFFIIVSFSCFFFSVSV
jgi:hypothetical protein